MQCTLFLSEGFFQAYLKSIEIRDAPIYRLPTGSALIKGKFALLAFFWLL